MGRTKLGQKRATGKKQKLTFRKKKRTLREKRAETEEGGEIHKHRKKTQKNIAYRRKSKNGHPGQEAGASKERGYLLDKKGYGSPQNRRFKYPLSKSILSTYHKITS